jgi:hypothetical protein
MNRTLRLLAVLGIGVPAMAQAWTVEGVDMDAVPWATLCPKVKAVELRTGAGSCATVHPASKRLARWTGFGMGVEEPKPKCARLEQEYKKWTSPKSTSGKPSSNPSVTWGFCISAFSGALKQRVREPERYSEPFEQWRDRYFASYIVNGR